MMWLIAALAVAGSVVLIIVIARRSAASHVPTPRREPWSQAEPSGQVLRLDVAGVDPEDEAVQRLARDAARRALQADPALDHVDVQDRDGRWLVREERRQTHREIVLPESLSEPHAPTHHGPSPVRPAGEDAPRGRVPEPPPTVAEVPLADRLELTDAIRTRVGDPTRAVDVVHAILLAAGRPSTVEGDLIRCGDVAIVVVDPRSDAERALTHGYLRIEETDASRGLVLRTGYADPRIVRRREATAPHVRHVGPDALQRMADAVAVGADPLAFAATPAATSAPPAPAAG